MQSVSLYAASSAFLVVLTLIASTTCQTTSSGSSSSPVTPMAIANDTTPANIAIPSEAPAQNDEAKVDPINAPPPTRIPTDAAVTSTKPPMIHDPKSTGTTMPNNGTMTKTNGTMGNPAAANTDNKNAASARGSEMFVTSLVLLVVRAFFA